MPVQIATGGTHGTATTLTAVVPDATPTSDGCMTAADKAKLDAIGPSLLTFGAQDLTTLGGGEGGTVLFLPPGWTAGQAQVPQLGPRAKRRYRLQNLTVTHYAAPGNGNTIFYTVFVGGVPTVLACQRNANQTGEAADTVNTVEAAPDDIIAIGASAPFAIGNGNVVAVATLEIVPI